MPEHRDHYAIVVGIRDYARLTPLLAASGDAAAFIEWLTAPTGGGLPNDNVFPIWSDANNGSSYPNVKPIQRDIDLALGEIFRRVREAAGGRLYFYFSGHGFGKSFDEVGLLMPDAEPDALNSNLGINLYRSYLRDHHYFDEIVYILDCCRDPSPPNRQTFMSPPRFSEPVFGNLDNIQDFVILGAAYGGKAWEGRDETVGKRRGLLTAALLEGLNGQAADAEGRITADSLRHFLQKRVPSLAKIKKMRQEPEILEPGGTNPFLFAVFQPAPVAPVPQVTNTPNVPITINTVGLKGELIVRHGTDFHEIRRLNLDTASGKPWRFDLPADSRYAIQHMPSNRFFPLDPKEQNGTPVILEFNE